MSYTKETVIWCDSFNCENYERFYTNDIVNAEKNAKTEGWAKKGNWKHYCPTCTEVLNGKSKSSS